MPYAKVKELPEAIQALLAEIGYHRVDISVEAAEKVSPLYAGSSGRKGFFAIVDLANSRHALHYGSWGGGNCFNPTNQVDLDGNYYQIPPNVATVSGSVGDTTYATVTVRPDTIVPLLPAASNTLTAREKWILYTFSGLTSAGRKNEWERERKPPTATELDEMVAKGWLKRNKAGAMSITTEGKNACGRRPGSSVPYAED